jgi:lipopolysaccharide/colanic/teichoic acid biosynthesis glycosyltransferase
MLKRSFDFVLAVLGLLLLSPLLVLVALWVKLDSRGPVFYRGVRAGRNGVPFEIFKFRSMVANADKVGGASTSGDDPRVTRSGRFIRRFKLDELSQLINVLRGEMSFVGPRPEITSYTDRYEGEVREILSVRPGITDWASIWNADEGGVLAGARDPGKAYEVLIQPTKLQLQLRYVRSRSFVGDVKIIICTLIRIVRPDFYPAELADVPRLQLGAGAKVP